MTTTIKDKTKKTTWWILNRSLVQCLFNILHYIHGIFPVGLIVLCSNNQTETSFCKKFILWHLGISKKTTQPDKTYNANKYLEFHIVENSKSLPTQKNRKSSIISEPFIKGGPRVFPGNLRTMPILRRFFRKSFL